MDLIFKPKFKRTKLPKSELVKLVLKKPQLALRELHNRSFYRFLLYMWSEVSNEEFQPNWHIELLCDELQELAEKVAEQRSKSIKATVDDLIVNVPPGSSKTTIMSILFPAWCWTRWYWMEFICLSYSATLSLESAESSRDLIKSEKFQQMYPDLTIKADKDQKSNFTVLKQFTGIAGYAPSIKTGGSRFSTSVGGSLTGFHGHIILVDDPINPEQAVSPVQLQAANRWLDQTLPTRKIHKGVSPTVYLMQRLHENDPTGHKLAKKKKHLKHICLPGEIKDYKEQVRPPELIERYDKSGLLDPIRMSWEVLEDYLLDLGQYGYAGQIGQSPTPPTGGMFKIDRLIVLDRLPVAHEILSFVRYWDKAGTTETPKSNKNRGPAYTVGLKMALLRNGKYVVVDVVRGRWSSEVREETIRNVAEADGRACRIGIEQEPGSGGKESAENSVKNLAGFRITVDSPKGDKAFRADPFSVQVNSSNVYLLAGAWNKDYMEELKFFPYSTFKDQVDASSGAFHMLAGKRPSKVLK